MKAPQETVMAFVHSFIEAWPERNASPLTAYFAEDAVYANGPLQPVRGREAICATLTEFMGMGGEVSVDIRHVVAEGSVVMTERVDHFTSDGRTISLPVMGTFELHGGVIHAWRDYFDLNQFTAQMNPTG